MNYDLSKKQFSAQTPTRKKPQSAGSIRGDTPYTPKHDGKKETEPKTIHVIHTEGVKRETPPPKIGASSPTKRIIKKFPPRKYEDKEIKELLVGYIELGKPDWHTLDKTDHIRWINTKGQFRRGGFVKTVYTRGGKHFLLIGTNIGREGNGITFPVAFDDISKLYKKSREDYSDQLKQYDARFKLYEARLKQYEEKFKQYDAKFKQYETALLQINKKITQSK